MINLLFYLIIFTFGLAVGSFLNCIIYRLEKGESFLRGRSYCPYCKKELSWRDLIPVFSFLVLKGRCRHCRKKISGQYPLVELATGALFFLVSLINVNINIFTTVNLLLMTSFLIIIFVYDLKHYIIPDKIIYPAIVVAFCHRFFEILKFDQWDLFRRWKLEIARPPASSLAGEVGRGNLEPLLTSLAAAFLASGFFLVIVLVSKGHWMGRGDIKLAFFMGLFLGFPDILFALFSSFLLGAIIGIGLIVSGKKTLKSEIPFGPFLVTGTFLSLFFGEQIINWYLNFF